jgi:peptide/nickel transport system ATP-binding protein
LLVAESVGKSFQHGLLARGAPVVALRDFSVIFNENEPRIIALAGQSGSGKTTAAQLVLGLARPTSGDVRYRGQALPRLSKRDQREFRREVQAVLQDPYGAFNPFYRVRHVFDVAARKFSIGSGAVDRAQAIGAALEFVGLDPSRVLNSYPHELSGGERQRLMIARAFLLRPRLIVADEPVSMVDASLRATILEIITRLKNEGISFLYITHDLSTAYHLADELIVLLDGETVERGPARSVIDDPQHSYTRLLVDSVPVPDPDVRWDEPATGGQASGDSGLDARSPAGAAPRAVSARALIFPFSLNTHQKGRRDAR